MSRKSDVALQTIMNVFLMIAVILVASSFLLKAFGIDLWGFLGNLFGKLFLQPGKLLYVKMDPDQDEIFQFRVITPKLPFLVDEEAGRNFKSYFYLEKFPPNQCTLFVVDENSPIKGIIAIPEFRDEGFVYYLPSGTVIQDDCGNNLKECISKYKYEGDCKFGEAVDSKEPCDVNCRSCSLRFPTGECTGKTLFSCRGKFNYIDCDPNPEVKPYEDMCSPKEIDKQNVMVRNFGTLGGEKDCKDGKEYCKILNDDEYSIEYGLICGEDGIWYPCTDKTNPTEEHGGGTCKWDGVVGTWKFTQAKTEIVCAFSDNCIFDKRSINLGDPVIVAGFLKTQDGKPIEGKPLKLFIVKDGSYEPVINADGSATELGPTNKDGYAVIYWIPYSSFSGDKKYYLGFDGDSSYEKTPASAYSLNITVQSSPLPAPKLVSPNDGAVFYTTPSKPVAVTFTWESVPDASCYLLKIWGGGMDPTDFKSEETSKTVDLPSSSGVSYGYKWYVRASQSTTCAYAGEYSDIRSLYITPR